LFIVESSFSIYNKQQLDSLPVVISGSEHNRSDDAVMDCPCFTPPGGHIRSSPWPVIRPELPCSV
jgi:hypothetical protein